MEVYAAIQKRRSIRQYTRAPVEDEKLQQLLHAARYAPSSKNRQNWKFIVVKDQTTRERLVDACYGKQFIAQAPVVIAGVADPTLRWYRVDMGITFEHIALAATELGLGTCWIGSFEEGKVSQILHVPPDHETVILMTVGYADETPEVHSRKQLNEVVCYESFS
jgi:nitroreductase